MEFAFALKALADNHPESVLDVGTGTTAFPHLLRNCGYVVTAIDNVKDYWPEGMVNRHWPVLDVDIVRPNGRSLGGFDAITCVSVLEHIENHVAAIQNMASLLKPSGILVLTTPFSHHNPHPNVYLHADTLRDPRLPYICRSSSGAELEQWISCGLSLERKQLWSMFTGPVWATGKPCPWRESSESQPHQLGCFLFRKPV
ncbi:MAG TPA: class I SAM-dependent methyltransferase [Terracidiphilus sp.]|nr:class I SAM-dependent methyltransferase [Terracidiphilus sp.]